MRPTSVFSLAMCLAVVVPFVTRSVGSIRVEHKAAIPDLADQAHHGTGKAAKPHSVISPGIVSAVLKVKLAPSTGTKHTACIKAHSGKCAKNTEWEEESLDDSEEDNSEENDEDNTSVQEQDEKTSVKVVSGLDDSIEEEDYGKNKKSEQNEISDVPVFSGSYVGVDEEEEFNEGFPHKEWVPEKHFVGDHRHLENVPHYGHGGRFPFQYPPTPIPVPFNIHDSVFENPNVYEGGYYPSMHTARAPLPYHSLIKYRKYNTYPVQEPSLSHLISALTVQKHKKEMLHVDDKIDLPKEKDNLKDASEDSDSTEISIASKIDVI